MGDEFYFVDAFELNTKLSEGCFTEHDGIGVSGSVHFFAVIECDDGIDSVILDIGEIDSLDFIERDEECAVAAFQGEVSISFNGDFIGAGREAVSIGYASLENFIRIGKI